MAPTGPSDVYNNVKWRSLGESSPTVNAPAHPIPAMQGAFEESMLETITEDSSPSALPGNTDSLVRRRMLLENPTYERTIAGRWKQKAGENYHPLWKLVAQISFGMHLLHRGLARSDGEVTRILQTHVDEIDGFLERTMDDLDLAQTDIDERVRYLKLPLEHGDVFDNMLDDRKFRFAILDGNEKIEHIVDRTSVALRDTLKDVKKGFEGTRELARYFKQLDATWERKSEEHAGVYAAMMGNTEGWTEAYLELQKKGNVLHEMLLHLGGIISEIQRRVGIASRKNIPNITPSRSNTQPSSNSSSLFVPSRSHSPGQGSRNFPTRSATGGYGSRIVLASDNYQQNRSPRTGNRHKKSNSMDSIDSSQTPGKGQGQWPSPSRRVSFSDRAKNTTSKMLMRSSKSPKTMSPMAVSPMTKTSDRSEPSSARGSDSTGRSNANGYAASSPFQRENKRSFSSSTPPGHNDTDSIIHESPRHSGSSDPRNWSAASSPAQSSFMVPLRMSESVIGPPSGFLRNGHNSFPEQVIEEEDEGEGTDNREETEAEEDLGDLEPEILDVKTKDFTVSGRTSPSSHFRPTLRDLPLRNFRSTDSLPSQTHGHSSLKRNSSLFSHPSLTSAIARLRRSSTFHTTSSGGIASGTNYTYSPASSTQSGAQSELMRPAPLNLPATTTAATFARRDSSPTSLYTENSGRTPNSTSGSRTPPHNIAKYQSLYKFGSESSGPRSAPPGRTSFFQASASTTKSSTPQNFRSPRSSTGTGQFAESPQAPTSQPQPRSPLKSSRQPRSPLPFQQPKSPLSAGFRPNEAKEHPSITSAPREPEREYVFKPKLALSAINTQFATSSLSSQQSSQQTTAPLIALPKPPSSPPATTTQHVRRPSLPPLEPRSENGHSPPPQQSPNSVAPELVPAPPRPQRVGSHAAPEHVPTPRTSPTLKQLTSATMSGPEPDFNPFEWNGGESENEEESPEMNRSTGVELEAPVHVAELSGEGIGTDEGASGVSSPSKFHNGGIAWRGTDGTDEQPDEKGKAPRRRSETILVKEVEGKRKPGATAAKRELEALSHKTETMKLQAEIISRVAQKTGSGASENKDDDENLREKTYPTGNTRILHQPPPVLVSGKDGNDGIDLKGTGSGSSGSPAGGAVQPYVYPLHSPLNAATSSANLSVPEQGHQFGSGGETRQPNISGQKMKSPWRKVFTLGGNSSSNSNSNYQTSPSHERHDNTQISANAPNFAAASSAAGSSRGGGVQVNSSEKEKKGLGISLGSAFGRKGHSKSRSDREARLVAAADRRGYGDGYAGNEGVNGGSIAGLGMRSRSDGQGQGQPPTFHAGAGYGGYGQPAGNEQVGNGMNATRLPVPQGARPGFGPPAVETASISGVGTRDFGVSQEKGVYEREWV